MIFSHKFTNQRNRHLILHTTQHVTACLTSEVTECVIGDVLVCYIWSPRKLTCASRRLLLIQALFQDRQ